MIAARSVSLENDGYEEELISGYGLNLRIATPLLKCDYFILVRHFDRSGTGEDCIMVKRR